MTDPLVWTEPVRDEWIDYNGHLSEPYYVLAFGHATDAVMEHICLGPEHRARDGASLFTVEAHVRYLHQVPAGADLEVQSALIGATDKLLWIWHELRVEGTLRATEEVLGVHVDTTAGRSSPFPAAVRARIDASLVLPGPDASRAIRVDPR
jgi:acyl-CoA thioester hydrolase